MLCRASGNNATTALALPGTRSILLGGPLSVFFAARTPLVPLITLAGGERPPSQAAKMATATHKATAFISRNIVSPMV